MSENNDKPIFSIEKLYVKDLSLEVPGAPAVFKQQGTQQIEITMNKTPLSRLKVISMKCLFALR